ncbi:MAG: SagB/ThcOx family dehydrogenase [Anaerolineae bacterium]
MRGWAIWLRGAVLVLDALLAACTPEAAPLASPFPSQPPPTALLSREPLPPPRTEGPLSLEEALLKRRSVRAYTDRPLTREEVGQLLWAAQGITREGRYRTAPSAGALYPLELYVADAEGVWHYLPQEHALEPWRAEDRRPRLCPAALSQAAVCRAPAVFVVTGVFARTAQKYGDRATRYVWLEAGHAAQNLLLQAVALGLGAVPIGAFYDEQVQAALNLPPDHAPLYLIPVGEPAE